MLGTRPRHVCQRRRRVNRGSWPLSHTCGCWLTSCFTLMQVGPSFITARGGKTPDPRSDNSRGELKIFLVPNWKRPCVNESDVTLNRTPSPRGRAGGQRVLSWRWGQMKRPPFRRYVNAPFVDAGAIPAANTEPHAGRHPHLYTHTSKPGSLYLNIQWKTLCVLHLWLPLKCSLEAISNSLLHANYLWLHSTLCFRGQLPTKWG